MSKAAVGGNCVNANIYINVENVIKFFNSPNRCSISLQFLQRAS